MHGASRGALADSQQQLRSVLAGEVDTARVGGELLAVTAVLDDNASLRRALGAPATEAQTKADLASRVFGGKVSESVLTLVRGVVGRRWSSQNDVADAMAQLGVEAAFVSADRRGDLGKVEDELFRFERVVAGDDALRDALTNRQRSGEDKQALVERLLAGKVESETLQLAVQAAAHPRGKRFDAAVTDYLQTAAAMHGRLSATVTVAVPISPEHLQRLQAALERIYGQPVQTNVVVDRSILGGVRVQLGDEVIDGTIQRRMEEARRQMAG